MNIDECLTEVSAHIRKFLAVNGGYSNGYHTYVSGSVKAEQKQGTLNWCTPSAREELTSKGLYVRGSQLYSEIREILEKHDVDRVEIRAKDLGYGAMKTEVVYVVEAIQEVDLI